MRVIVIGAGIVGASAALTLAGQGVDVVLLDRGLVGGEASGLNAGLIGGGGWGEQPDVDVALSMGSRDRFIHLVDDLGYDISLDQTGTLVLIRTEEEWEWAKTTVDADKSKGRCFELVDSQALRTLEPAADPSLFGAVFDPLAAHAEPDRATQAFAAAAATQGVDVRPGCGVTGLGQLRGGGWQVDVVADGQTIQVNADAVVIAAGPWCNEIGRMVGVDIPVVAVRGQMWASAPQPRVLRHGIAGAEAMCKWATEVLVDGVPPSLTHDSGRRTTRHLYGRQRLNGEIVFGGDRLLTSDRTVDPAGIAVNHQHTGEMFPGFAGWAPARTWSGLMPFSLDGRPLIGPVSGCDGLFIAGGLASSGFGRGPMTGQLVAELVVGIQPEFDLTSVLVGDRVTLIEG
jgi:glycine/D-amino acid oxidase-like deaminating enzyme